MTGTVQEAVDDILTIFKIAWDTTGHAVDYENVTPADGVVFPPTTADPWARVVIRHGPAVQSSLSGAFTTQRYTRVGVFIVQIFVTVGQGLSDGRSLAKIVTDAYEGVASPRQVWFRNVRANEIGSDGDWFQINVLVDFTYDEVR